MTDRPIIFSGPMVRALLDGRKTQTRRVLPKAHPRFPHHNNIRTDVLVYDPQRPEVWYWDGVHDRVGASYPVPYAPGDRLYVREEYFALGHWVPDGLTKTGKPKWRFVQDGETIWYDAPDVFRTSMDKERPQLAQWYRRLGRFMPRWASRLTLTVTEVRVQRLQEISEADAKAEGARREDALYHGIRGHQGTHVEGFESLWRSLHGPDAWCANPWVAAVSFTVDRRNIDSITNP